MNGEVPPLAARGALYTANVSAAGNVAVVIWSGGIVAAIWMLKLALAFCAGELESVTLAVKEKVPDAVGVPEMSPEEEFKLVPGGSCPEETAQ